MSIHRKSRRALRLAAALTVLVPVVLAASSVGSAKSASPAATKSPFNVLLVVPKSGPLGFVGVIEAHGMVSAARIINRNGGILGHRVSLKIIDDQADGAKAAALVQQELASGTKYNLISCGSFGSDAVPCASVVAKENALQIPLAAEDALNDTKKFPNIFVTSGGFQPGADGVVLKLKSKKITRFAILSGDDATGHNGASALQTAASKYGLTVTSTVFVPSSASDATPQVQQAQASGPQAFAMSGFTGAIPAIFKARTKLGLTSVPFYTDWLVGSFNFGLFSTANDRSNVYFQEVPYFVQGTPQYQSKVFQNFMNSFYQLDSAPGLMLDAPYVAYNALMMARGAAIKAKSIDGNAMTKALASTTLSSDIPGFIGGKLLYGGKSRFMNWKPSDFIFVNAGVQEKGILVPDK